MNRPWSMWWDFQWEGEEMTGVIIQSDHPKYGGDHMTIPLKEVQDKNGQIDSWVSGPFQKLQDDLQSGRISMSKWHKNPSMSALQEET